VCQPQGVHTMRPVAAVLRYGNGYRTDAIAAAE
jgi:hypothetical protein